MFVHRWGRIAAGLALVSGCLACGDGEKPRKKAVLDDDEPSVPMTPEERARSRQEDATKLCAKLQASGAREAIEPHSFELDFDYEDRDDGKENCAKLLVVLLRDLPATYWKIAECARKDDRARSCASEIKYSDENYKKGLELLKEDIKKEKIEKVARITELKTTPVTLKARGYSDVERSVTLDLPANLNDGSATLPAFIQWKESDDAKKGPSLTVRERYSMPSMDDALRSASASDKIVKQEKTDQGYVIAIESSYSLEVSVVQKLPPNDYSQPAMECEARFSDTKAIAAKDKILPWLEKLCSMKISK